MNIDINLIFNFLIAIFVYNVILKAITGMFFKWLLKSDTAKEVKKTFKERLQDKLKDNAST